MLKCRWQVVFATAFILTSSSEVLAGAWDRLPVLAHVGDDFATHPRQQILVTGLRVGQVKITFEKTRWSDLQNQLGSLRLRQQGDGAEWEKWACLTVGHAGSQSQIWLDGSEMAGAKLIDGVTAIAGTPWPLNECPQAHFGSGPIALDSGVWIGTSRASLLKRLGRPTAVHGTSITYDYSVPVRDRQLGEGAAVGRISFEVKANRVVRLTANKDTSF